MVHQKSTLKLVYIPQQYFKKLQFRNVTVIERNTPDIWAKNDLYFFNFKSIKLILVSKCSFGQNSSIQTRQLLLNAREQSFFLEIQKASLLFKLPLRGYLQTRVSVLCVYIICQKQDFVILGSKIAECSMTVHDI